jgi:hypothetical protein
MSEPVQCTARELMKVNIHLISEPHVWLRCRTCGRDWVPDLNGDGNLPVAYWRCPNGCNAKKQ